MRNSDEQGAFRSREAVQEEMNRIPIFGHAFLLHHSLWPSPIWTQPVMVTMSRAPVRSCLVNDIDSSDSLYEPRHLLLLKPRESETLRNSPVPHPALL